MPRFRASDDDVPLDAGSVYVLRGVLFRQAYHFTTLHLHDDGSGKLYNDRRVTPVDANGATAMKEMAHCDEADLIGCTQATEINYTDGVVLVANLPKEFELATDYTLGVCTQTTQPDLAQTLAAWLTGAQSEPVRRQGGFEF